MCGIVAALSNRNVVDILMRGLQRLEYRGYDSCGLAVHRAGGLQRTRSTARVEDLSAQVHRDGIEATLGIAHTRWATHGAPKVDNAHPHFSPGPGANAQTPARIAVVHNGIIENHDELRATLQNQGYVFESQTDTEVIAHLIDSLYSGNLLEAVSAAVVRLRGAYAIAVMCRDESARLVGARAGSPLVLGVQRSTDAACTPGIFLVSDAMALAGVSDQIIYLQEGDVVDVCGGHYRVHTRDGRLLQAHERPLKTVALHSDAAELGPYRHHMQKEIFEQPAALANTLEGVESLSAALFDHGEQTGCEATLKAVDRVLILACGTSYYSGCTARYWLEDIAGIPTHVEIASEYRYRTSVPDHKTLVLTISQSGETADTLAALRHAQSLGMTHTLTICNVATSTLVRESRHAYITRAGMEIGVASTKAFTAQLAGLFLLTLVLAQIKGNLTAAQERAHLQAMRHLPAAAQAALALEPQIMAWSEQFARVQNAIFLGRGLHYPIALEGALKLKEISYIHAEGYPAGELKHGPLALVTDQMPVVVVAPNDALLDKLKSNMHEVRARGGTLYVLADADSHLQSEEGVQVIRLPEHYGALSPILHTIPLQLLAYHTACAREEDVDKPRNLAKSVTVE